ncbi:MAG TPA: glucoamylase family protein, partial [Leptolinea sp.]
MKPERLDTLIQKLVEIKRTSLHPARGSSIQPLIKRQKTLLSLLYKGVSLNSQNKPFIPVATEWLLDNYYLVQQTLKQIMSDMPAKYYRRLPKLTESPLKGFPNILAHAQEFINTCDCHFDLDQLSHHILFTSQLTLGELWAIPTMLRIVVLETIVQTLYKDTIVPISFNKQFIIQKSLNINETIAHCFTTLRNLNTWNWKDFVESISQVEAILRNDPAQVYATMDFSTRDRYRKVIEHLAVNAHMDEVKVAQTAINIAKEVSQNYLHEQDPEDQIDKIHFDLLSHVGYYLVDKGRPTLEKAIGYKHPWVTSFKKLIYRFSTLYYLGLITIFTVIFLSGLILLVQPSLQNLRILFLMGFVGIIPAAMTAVQVVNWITTHLIPPRVLPKLDFENGVPSGFSTMVVIPTLLSSDSYIDELLQKLEINFIGNDDPNIFYALLTDFIDAPEESMPDDEMLLTKAQNLITDLNNKYQRSTGQIFYLLNRRRLWNPSENCWMGWERKRGKLMEFNQLILGNLNTTYILSQNQIKTLPKPRFIITLDSDTYMPHKTSNQLIGALAHPLNQAIVDKKSNQVLRGYTLLQPHIGVTPTSASQSTFSRIFQGEYGLDLYTPAISDLYQDLFGSGIYAGKGIYDLNSFWLCLKDRCPENALLSHDLFEGVFARLALVSDIVLFEEYPSTYHAQIKRSIRWVRGDWQILPWLFARVPDATGKKVPNQLSLIDRWKILDNLIRSLFYPSLFILLLFGWFMVPASALAVTLITLGVAMIPFVLGITSRLLRGVMAAMSGPIQTALWFNASESLGYSIKNSFFQWSLNLAFLPHRAVMMINAIVITLVRVFLTHRRLLQWTTAAHNNALNYHNSSVQVWKTMIWSPIISLIIAGTIMWLTPSSFLVAAPLLILWFISPQLAYWISLPPTDKKRLINEEQEQIFRQLARRTWQYYEHFAGPEDNWLAPDHYQEDPRGVVIHSTSPTNIGMHLLSILGAKDMGYIGVFDMMLFLFMTLDTLTKLERYRGHILNWYDTRTLTPLQPRYISVVDSGNFAACLLALKQGCLGLLDMPLLNWQNWQGFLDTVDVLADVLSHLEKNPESQVGKPLLNLLHSFKEQIIAIKQKPEVWISTAEQLKSNQMEEFKKCTTELANSNLEGVDAAILRDLRVWTELVHKAADKLFADAIGYMPWLPILTPIPTLNSNIQLQKIISIDCQKLYELLKPNTSTKVNEIANLCTEGLLILEQINDQLTDLDCTPEEIEPIHIWCNGLRESLQQAIISTEALQVSMVSLSNQAEYFFNEMDFTFMFDEDRKVFYIGYNVTTGKLDENHYDLAASESRIASLIAIAKGDVPASHWQHLGRPQTTVGNYRTVLSWSGTMFEYLMPNLLAKNPERTLLGQSCRAIVERQIEYGTQKGVPWGISESGYYGFDAQLNYQYRAFGVPGLGFKRDLDEDLVITPYASILAISINPSAVYENILELIHLKMMGECGFYEAIDYTISRMPLGQ